MPTRRTVAIAALVAAAVIVQVALLPPLGLPGAPPDLVVVVTVALALAEGPVLGAVAGFAAGLGLDLLPPADHEAGRWALTLCLLGYLCGFVRVGSDRSVATPLLLVGGAAIVAHVVYAGIGGLLGDPRTTLPAVIRALPAATLYDVLLAPFVVPAVGALCRRLRPGSPLAPVLAARSPR